MTWKRMDPNRCPKKVREPLVRSPVAVRVARKGRCMRKANHPGKCSLFKDES